jgi:hypothetical protein
MREINRLCALFDTHGGRITVTGVVSRKDESAGTVKVAISLQ